MPFTKAQNYKRFNVGEYMRHKRLGWLAVEEKNKKSRKTYMKLKRLDEKVRDFIIFIPVIIFRVDLFNMLIIVNFIAHVDGRELKFIFRTYTILSHLINKIYLQCCKILKIRE